MIVSGLAATFYNAPFKSYILISPLIGLFAAYLVLALENDLDFNIYCRINYLFHRYMFTLIDKDIFTENFRKILNYVPSVVFPLIFRVFFDD